MKFEPLLAELIEGSRENGLIDFTTDMRRRIEHADVIFIVVPTPMGGSGAADLHACLFRGRRCRVLHGPLSGCRQQVDRPGRHCRRSSSDYRQEDQHEFDVVSNPEFLKQGKAIRLHDRVVISGDSERALYIMRELHEPFLRTFHPLIEVDIGSLVIAEGFCDSPMDKPTHACSGRERLEARIDCGG